MKTKKYFVAGAVLVAGGLFGLAVSDLATFKAGDAIKSAEVNGNFSILKSAVEALEAPVGLSRLEIQGAAVNGKTLKFKDGSLAWEDDQIGAGSGGGDISAVGAGTGLEGGGTSGDVTLQIAGAFRLPQSCSGGQVPKWNGSLWACGSDDVGTGGGGGGASGDITRVSAGSGLSGGGDSGDVTLSLADNGVTSSKIASGAVTTSKLADGAVTASKLAFPLTVELNSGNPLLSITNTGSNGIQGISSGGGIGLLGRSSARGVVGTQGSLVLSCAGTYGVGGCAETNGTGVYGRSASGVGVDGFSQTFIGTRGQGGGGVGLSITEPIGVLGESPTGIGVRGASRGGYGVFGQTFEPGSAGVRGDASGPTLAYGVYGTSTNGVGVYGESTNNAGVFGRSTNNNSAFFSGGNGGSGTCRYNGGAGWICTSDRNKKENFSPVDSKAVLEAVAKMPITRWNMKGDAKKTPHIGPVAQDFFAAFKLGDDDKTINSADAQGVAFAAIKGLYQENQTLKAQNLELAQKLNQLEAQMTELQTMQAKVAAIEARLKR